MRARAFYRGYTFAGRRSARVTRLHIIREDGKWAGVQGLCGTSARTHQGSQPVILDPMPTTPPEGLRWCADCVGQLAERVGCLDRFAAELAGAAA